MKLLNNDIKDIIFSNLKVNDIQVHMKSIKCLVMLKILVRLFINEHPYTLYVRSGVAAFSCNVQTSHYYIPVTEELREISKYRYIVWEECLKEGIFIAYIQGTAVIYINSNTKYCSVLQLTATILNRYINQENSTFTLHYKCQRKCLKVFNSEGSIVHDQSFCRYKINLMVYDNDKLYFTDYKSKALKLADLKNDNVNNIYTNEKNKIQNLFLQNKYLFTTIENAILLFDTRNLQKISVIQLNDTPRKFYPLTLNSVLVLYNDNFFYELNTQNNSFKRLYFEFDRHIDVCAKVHLGKDETVIIELGSVYYVIDTVTMSCIYKGDSLISCVYGINNKIMSFKYSRNNPLFLEIKEYELIDFSKVIDLNNLLPNENLTYMNEYQIPLSKNFIFSQCPKTYYYYNYLNNTVEHIFEADIRNIIPFSSKYIYYEDEGNIILYNYRNKTNKVLFKFTYVDRFEKVNNSSFIIIHDHNNIKIYDHKLKCIIFSERSTSRFPYFEKIFDGLFYITTCNEALIYAIKQGKVEKLWDEPMDNFFIIHYNYKEACLITKDRKMVCFDRQCTIIVKQSTRENIKSLGLASINEKHLLSLIKENDCLLLN
jgi:hypothetical protein